MQYCIPFDPVSAQYPDRRRSEETRTWDLQSTWQAQRFTNNASHSGVNQLFVDNAPLCIPGNRFPSQTMPRPAFPVLSPNRTSYPAGGYHEPVRFGDLHDTMIQYPSNYDNYYRPHFPIDYNSCCLNHPLQGQFEYGYRPPISNSETSFATNAPLYASTPTFISYPPVLPDFNFPTTSTYDTDDLLRKLESMESNCDHGTPNSGPQTESTDMYSPLTSYSVSLSPEVGRRSGLLGQVNVLDGFSPSNKELLSMAFTTRSTEPNFALRTLLEDVLHSDYLRNQKREPLLSEPDGQLMVANVAKLAGFPPVSHGRKDQSLYALFLEPITNRCLFCSKIHGEIRGVLSRAIGCVRAHLEHRPFRCSGCGPCSQRQNGPRRFFAPALLKNHLRGQERKYECVHPDCNKSLYGGGMLRHWRNQHKESPFPYIEYPGYRKPKANTAASMSA